MRLRPLALLCAFAIPAFLQPLDARAAGGGGPKQFIKAEIRGERLKFWKPTLIGSYTSISFTLGGGSKPNGYKLIHGFAITCPVMHLETVPLPTTLTNCAASYVTSKPKPGGGSKTWTSSGDITVTVESYEDEVVRVKFSGSIDAAAPNSAPPAVVKKGSAAIRLTDTGV